MWPCTTRLRQRHRSESEESKWPVGFDCPLNVTLSDLSRGPRCSSKWLLMTANGEGSPPRAASAWRDLYRVGHPPRTPWRGDAYISCADSPEPPDLQRFG